MLDNLTISVDCEGLYKHKPISLLQICYNGISYIFDLMLLDLNYAPSVIQVLLSAEIYKVCHDFCEDAAGLFTTYGIQCVSLFDT